MENPLQAHILFLEQAVQELCDSLTSKDLPATERERIQQNLEQANRALDYYRKAFELEHVLQTAQSAAAPQPGHATAAIKDCR